MTSGYRVDVDGLRGVSIICVVLYHLGLESFGGGFVGVDIFFVISGFVITNLIYKQVKNNEFSFLNFYSRRVRRLLPAMLFTLSLTLCVSFFILSPQHFERMGGTLIASLFAVSNFYFIGEVGYFDVGVTFKPLLHTWSLGVEEQFYLIWPAVLLFIVRTKNTPLRIAVISAASIASLISLAASWYFGDSKSAFFFTPFRIYEFYFGILLVFLPDFHLKNIYREVIFLIGASLIVLTVMFVDLTASHVSTYAFISALGAAAVIFSNNPNVTGILLRNRAIVFVGKISYSLYLIHWPVFVLISYYYFTPVDQLSAPAIFISLALSIFMYFYIERPFRYKANSSAYNHFSKIMPAAAIAISVLAAHAWQTDGWTWRFYDSKHNNIMDYVENSRLQSNENFEKHNVVDKNIWSNGKTNVLIIGDSHADDMLNALTSVDNNRARFNFRKLFFTEDCFRDDIYKPSPVHKILIAASIRGNRIDDTQECHERRLAVAKDYYLLNSDIIVFANNIPVLGVGRVPNYIKFIRELSDAKIVLFGINKLPYDPPTLLLVKPDNQNINTVMFGMDRSEIIQVNAFLESVADKTAIPFFNDQLYTCPAKTGECLILHDGKLLFDDDNHWSIDGERYFGKLITNLGILSDDS